VSAMTTFTTINDARAYVESILHSDATDAEIDSIAANAWDCGDDEAFRDEYPDDSPAWFALLDAAAYAADWS
jgi:hypothetical protein